jgi:hypothetical protein
MHDPRSQAQAIINVNRAVLGGGRTVTRGWVFNADNPAERIDLDDMPRP